MHMMVSMQIMDGCRSAPIQLANLTWDNALLISPVLANILESKHPGLGLLPKPTMLNKNGQIAPDAAQFDGGKQKAPVVTVKVGGKSITAPLVCSAWFS